jgi:hypothetical protein
MFFDQFYIIKLNFISEADVDANIQNGNNEISATEVVEFDEHAKQVIDDNMVEVSVFRKYGTW